MSARQPGPCDHTSPRIIHITAARRIGRSERPEIEPPMLVKPLVARIPEKDRAIIAEAEVRLDMRTGDLDMVVLRKCNFVFEHAKEAFANSARRSRVVRNFVTIVQDYGEPEGVPLLQKALEKYGTSRPVRFAISTAISRIGDESCLDLLLNLVRMDVMFPKPHLDSLLQFAQSYPTTVPAILANLNEFTSHPDFRNALGQVREIS
ncbi:Uncharacterised protein [Candidatus Bilamarchaeum dharawalense]|uniref:HEAT repeats n=1 Tax=Candidatus Bilamarchaeum dharawalense TaxID=2885759 RepID=A0A5E4LS19_9ARCH|nr:Uncharacterised protein [Candidatus Bilamarchaeum dharawalense]